MFQSALRRCVLSLPNIKPSCTNRFYAYDSALSLKNLYPNSSLSLASTVKIPESKAGEFNGFIPIEKLDITYSRSSGPGGQNVNVVNTKVDIRFHIQSADWLSSNIKETLLESCKNRINKDGYLVIRSEKTRSQIYNQADAITTLRELIRAAATPKSSQPSEETLHRLRKKKEKANIERLREKRMKSVIKNSRSDLDL